MYPTNQFSGIPMQSYVGEYNTMGEIRETMMTQGVPQQLSMMQQYVQTPMFNKSSPAPAASMAHSTRITGDANSVVYYHDGQNNQLNEHSVRQMITADGTVFVEHIPGYSLVYVPNNRPAEQILGMDTNTRASNGSSSKGHGNSTVSRAVRNHKPKIKNAFILYRSFKYKELRKKHPEMNQTDISRLVGKLWGEELEEVKNFKMDGGFHYMYPTNQFGSTPMQSSLGGYSAAGSAPGMMGAQGDPQQLSMMQQYVQTPMFNKSSPAPAASMAHSTRITGDANSVVYYHDGQNNQLNEHSVRQMITADGTVFVEHIPGYSLVYVPNNRPAEQILGMNTNTRASNGSSGKGHGNSAAARAARNHTSKPSNAFIMYRNFKIKELREKFPEINQIEISRMAGDLWKEESIDVKERFREEYRKQKAEYDIKKGNNKRPRSETLGNGVMSDDEAQSVYSETGKRRKNSVSSLGLGAGNNGKPRSRTLPSNVLSSSMSRVDFSADLRKQVAARNGSAFLNSPSFDSSEFQQAYAELSASASMQNSPMPTIISESTYVNGDIPALSLGAVQHFSAAGMTSAEQEALYVSQHAAFNAGVDPSNLSSSDNNDLANSFINAGIAAGLGSIADTPGMSASIESDDIAVAASIATNNVLTSSFYEDAIAAPSAEQSAEAQWTESAEQPADTSKPDDVDSAAAVDAATAAEAHDASLQ
ncbi:hypothetical protein IWW42_000542 [Coemansia sp. RSA 1085]|nr:hypothetical protein IWW42_000542 [Coemansia sp. RSA 1085]